MLICALSSHGTGAPAYLTIGGWRAIEESEMEYTTLGRTGVEVSRLCLGTAMFGSWTDTVHEEAARVIHAALDAGINFVDTADQYSTGESETIVGKALAGGRRDDVVLATKFHFPQ